MKMTIEVLSIEGVEDTVLLRFVPSDIPVPRGDLARSGQVLRQMADGIVEAAFSMPPDKAQIVVNL